MASEFMISPLNLVASSTASWEHVSDGSVRVEIDVYHLRTSDLPVPVDPKITIKGCAGTALVAMVRSEAQRRWHSCTRVVRVQREGSLITDLLSVR